MKPVIIGFLFLAIKVYQLKLLSKKSKNRFTLYPLYVTIKALKGGKITALKIKAKKSIKGLTFQHNVLSYNCSGENGIIIIEDKEKGENKNEKS